MDGDAFTGIGNSMQSFVQVQSILYHNRLFINEINHYHEKVVDLYSDLSNSFTKLVDVSCDRDSGETLNSDGKPGHKRIRPD
uniref:Uncharacterized protein n=1 Tax=Nelumbo nucifera TaxID=4432 RepID=A0A822Y5V0_NELNU|nr:TPA_asm: hypothetical protein HUJ06_029368 [Nelumbo nucifera]